MQKRGQKFYGMGMSQWFGHCDMTGSSFRKAVRIKGRSNVI